MLHQPPRRWAIFALIALQAILLLARPGFLPLWTDELFTLQVVPHSFVQLLSELQADIHPPLYFLLGQLALLTPIPFNDIEKLRLLSALLMVAATIAIDRLWFQRLAPSRRLWALAWWTLSPVVLLYGRMARSYSLQVLLFAIAARFGLDLLDRPTSPRRRARFLAALTLLLYTHYVPGIAILATVGVVLLLRSWSTALLVAVTVLVTYLPWLTALATALFKWTAKTSIYSATGTPWKEEVVKLIFGFVSLFFGESGSLNPLVLLATPLVLVALYWGLRQRRDLWILGVALLVGYLGVSGWVSVVFIPARLLWILPVIVTLLAAANPPWLARRRPVFLLAAGAYLVWNFYGVSMYWSKDGFLNKGYVVPLDQIAADIKNDALQHQGIVYVDLHNTDGLVLQYYLQPLPVRVLRDDDTAEAITAGAAHYERFWFIRNTHDISPGHLNTTLERLLEPAQQSERYYLRHSWTEEHLMALLGWRQIPHYFYKVGTYAGHPAHQTSQ